MSKIKDIVLAVGGLILAFFYVSNKSKDRKIEKHKNEADRYKSEAEQQGYIAESERTAKHVKDRINSATESDIDSMLNKQGALRDRLSED